MTTSPIAIEEAKRLDHLPLASAVCRFLGLPPIFDQHLPDDPRNHVTPGECVQALVLTILTGEHALSRVSTILSCYDLEVIFQRPINSAHFHDNRLGHVLDDLWEAGLDRLYGAVITQAMGKYLIDLSRLHTDTTSLKVYGDYDREAEGPEVTYGFSKDHRPDLKQLLFGLTVSADGGVPVWGQVTDGNCSDSTAQRFHLSQLRQHLPDLQETLLVADSKFFAGETLLTAQRERIPFVTLVPHTVSLRRALSEEIGEEELPVLWERPGPRRGEVEVFRGRSVQRPYRCRSAQGEEQEMLLRFLVVHSTQLQKQKAATRQKERRRERDRLEKRLTSWSGREFACAADAREAGERFSQEESGKHHRLQGRVYEEEVIGRYPRRGRPRSGESRPKRKVFRVAWQIEEVAEASRPPEGCFVLATDVLEEQRLSDVELLQAYKGQQRVETSFRWAKNPAAIAPIFLEKPTRIAALGFVYLVALLVYTLVERQVRRGLAESGESVGKGARATEKPTAQTVFRLLQGVAAVVLCVGGERKKVVTTLTADQKRIVRLMGFEARVYAPPRQKNSSPRREIS
jgi:transposase